MTDLDHWHGATGVPVSTTRNALTLPDGLGWDEWEMLAAPLLSAAAGVQWWVGDWLVYAERHLVDYDDDGRPAPEDLARVRDFATREAGVEPSTLKWCRLVCRRFTPEKRRAGLSFGHHQVVAGSDYSDPEAESYLDDAEAGGMTVAEFRSHVRGRSLDAGEPSPAPVKLSRFAIAEAHAPAALSLLSRCDRALRPSLTADEVVALDELLDALRSVSKAA